MSQVNQVKSEQLCPRCGSKLQRVHRQTLDRLRSIVVPVRRYRCPQCDWTGLRRQAGRSDHSMHDPQAFARQRRMVALVLIFVLALVVALLLTLVILPQLNERYRKAGEVWPQPRTQVVAVFERSVVSF